MEELPAESTIPATSVSACPHILMRLPYGKRHVPVEEFNYEENVDGTDHSKYLWGERGLGAGRPADESFAQYGWCAAIRGVEGGGLVEGLPVHNFHTDEGDVAHEVPDRSADHGSPRKGTGGPGLRSAGALQGHRLRGVLQRAVGAEAEDLRHGRRPTANARLSAQLPYILAVRGSRII